MPTPPPVYVSTNLAGASDAFQPGDYGPGSFPLSPVVPYDESVIAEVGEQFLFSYNLQDVIEHGRRVKTLMATLSIYIASANDAVVYDAAGDPPGIMDLSLVDFDSEVEFPLTTSQTQLTRDLSAEEGGYLMERAITFGPPSAYGDYGHIGGDQVTFGPISARIKIDRFRFTDHDDDGIVAYRGGFDFSFNAPLVWDAAATSHTPGDPVEYRIAVDPDGIPGTGDEMFLLQSCFIGISVRGLDVDPDERIGQVDFDNGGLSACGTPNVIFLAAHNDGGGIFRVVNCVLSVAWTDVFPFPPG